MLYLRAPNVIWRPLTVKSLPHGTIFQSDDADYRRHPFESVEKTKDPLYSWKPVCTIQPVVKPVVQPDWQPVVSCKRAFRNKAGKQTSNRLSNMLWNGFDNRFDNHVERTALFVQPVVKPVVQPGLTTGCIHDTTGYQTGLTTVWQQVVSCKRGMSLLDD